MEWAKLRPGILHQDEVLVALYQTLNFLSWESLVPRVEVHLVVVLFLELTVFFLRVTVFCFVYGFVIMTPLF